MWSLIALVVGCASAAEAPPRWVEPKGASDAWSFEERFLLDARPDRSLIRLNARDAYRLVVNGTGVAVADTPFDGETWDVSQLLRKGENRVAVEVTAQPPEAIENCWVVLETSLPMALTGRPLDLLRFDTRGAKANECVYVELVDRHGLSSGYYCLEKGHQDFSLGYDGVKSTHRVRLAEEERLAPANGFSLQEVRTLRFRFDQKTTSVHPTGGVTIAKVVLAAGAQTWTLDLSPAAWTVSGGHGPWQATQSSPQDDGLRLSYDFRAIGRPALVCEIKAWAGDTLLLRRATGEGAFESPDMPLLPLAQKPNGPFEYTPLALLGPTETPRPRVDYMARCRVAHGTARWPVGKEMPLFVTVRALPEVTEAEARIEVRNWAGETVANLTAPLTWGDAEATGRGGVRLAALPRGFYRIDASLPGDHATDAAHFTAVSVMEENDTDVSALFDTLTPLAKRPFLQGVDVHYEDAPGWLFALQDLGVNFLHFGISSRALDDGTLDGIIALCRVLEVRFALNNEPANWAPSGLAADGHNRFRPDAGCHRWDLEPEALERAAATGLFEGVVYDEGEHMQLSRNVTAKVPVPDPEERMPYLVETTGMSLSEAYDAFYQAARRVQEYNAAHGSRAQVESVFPVLWHPFARAGWQLGPKLLKEDVHPVVIARLLGAALQYSDDLWLSPDLWYFGDFPGHDVREYTAALRLAYWMGVDKVYTEHMMVLVRSRGEQVDITPHGQALRAHIRHWLPAQHRDYTWREYRPEAAIVAFPTSDWGQGDCYYWDMLYGSLDSPTTPETGQWMRAFSVLTRGGTSPIGVNYNSNALPKPWPFTIPSPAVAVFDHLATEDVLKGIPVLLLCDGHLSETTHAAVRRCVQRGATCFTTPAHAPKTAAGQALPAVLPEGQGHWIVVSDYTPEALGDTMARLPEPGTTMRLRFGGRMIDAPTPKEIRLPR